MSINTTKQIGDRAFQKNVNGVKRAVLVGINYVGTANELQGCINDVNNVRNILISRYNYLPENIVLLTDETEKKPTRENILRTLFDLLLSNATDLYFHYSGHGSQVYDQSGDEDDKYDETIVPLDYETNGMIVDDELRGLMQCLDGNKSLTIVLDCCHSGTGVDLAFNLYTKSGKYTMFETTSNGKPLNRTRGRVICISGCKDNQTSADSVENNQNQGALTYSFVEALNFFGNGLFTYNDIFKRMSTTLKTKGYTQMPCLSSGRPLSLNERFKL